MTPVTSGCGIPLEGFLQEVSVVVRSDGRIILSYLVRIAITHSRVVAVCVSRVGTEHDFNTIVETVTIRIGE